MAALRRARSRCGMEKKGEPQMNADQTINLRPSASIGGFNF